MPRLSPPRARFFGRLHAHRDRDPRRSSDGENSSSAEDSQNKSSSDGENSSSAGDSEDERSSGGENSSSAEDSHNESSSDGENSSSAGDSEDERSSGGENSSLAATPLFNKTENSSSAEDSEDDTAALNETVGGRADSRATPRGIVEELTECFKAEVSRLSGPSRTFFLSVIDEHKPNLLIIMFLLYKLDNVQGNSRNYTRVMGQLPKEIKQDAAFKHLEDFFIASAPDHLASSNQSREQPGSL